jgi:uncharacterized protein YdhG (YjbR/CyaY superfamily)
VEKGAKTPASVEAYFAALPPDSRGVLEKLRKTIRAAAPTATEAISYQLPAFKYRGMGLVCYGAFKDHLSLFPMSMQAIEDNQEALEPFVSGKGTIRYTAERPLPAALVKRDRQGADRRGRRPEATLGGLGMIGTQRGVQRVHHSSRRGRRPTCWFAEL